MKKGSTAVGKGTTNFRDHKLTIGLDLGDRSSWYCVLDEAGEVLLEQKLGTTPKAMKEVFGGMPRIRRRWNAFAMRRIRQLLGC
jgi:transposase